MTTPQKFISTVHYIGDNVSSHLAFDLLARIRRAIRLSDFDTVMNSVLAGMSTAGAGIFVTNAAGRRQALRALLLCQEVYLSPLTQTADYRGDDWPQPTIDHWKWKSETAIKRAIEMYMPLPNAGVAGLLAAAATLPPVDPPYALSTRTHTVTRQDAEFPVESTCYRAVQSWLLASGCVSLQWLLASAVTQPAVHVTDANCVAAQLLRVFGDGTMIDVSDHPANLPARLVAGDIVYMYRSHQNGTPKAGGQLGHWMIYDTQGYAYGCNNFHEYAAHGVAPTYARCLIVDQILAMQHDTIVPNQRDWHFVRIFKPTDLEVFPAV
jgi:hypothetical protein